MESYAIFRTVPPMNEYQHAYIFFEVNAPRPIAGTPMCVLIRQHKYVEPFLLSVTAQRDYHAKTAMY